MLRRQSPTAVAIREMARQHHVQYVGTSSDALAHHMTRLTGDTVILDDVEWTLVALQRAGHLSRRELVHLQASYLREEPAVKARYEQQKMKRSGA